MRRGLRPGQVYECGLARDLSTPRSKLYLLLGEGSNRFGPSAKLMDLETGEVIERADYLLGWVVKERFKDAIRSWVRVA